jgi:hypothetical protein
MVSPSNNRNHSIMSVGGRRQAPDLTVVWLFAPSFRKARIALEVEAVSVAIDRYDDLRSVWLPFGSEPWIGQPSAQECQACPRTIGVDATAGTGFAMSTPRTARLVEFGNAHHLATERTTVARPAGQWGAGSWNSVHAFDPKAVMGPPKDANRMEPLNLSKCADPPEAIGIPFGLLAAGNQP